MEAELPYSNKLEFQHETPLQPPDSTNALNSSQADPTDFYNNTLPVTAHKSQLLELFDNNQISIVCGTTGSGKTTQIPQLLAKYGKVACTQPRRLAAMSVAARVADETHSRLGSRVGYSVRFDDKSSPSTQIKFLTDGILMREFIADRALSAYSAIMIDEAHERTLHTDIILTLLKQVCARRPDLKVVISSATLDSTKFRSFFQAPVYNVPGRLFPVDIYYTKESQENYIQAAMLTVLQIHMDPQSDPGDILVFLPGQEEIETMADSIQDAMRNLGGSIDQLITCPVYSSMPPQQQQRIFEPAPPKGRKVVIATNIAETSLTIEGIVYVIDPGFVKQKSFNPRSGMDSLTVQLCSQASANQRTGRAGRLQPGKCYRLYPKTVFTDMAKVPTPEILRTNLASVALLLMSLGVKNVLIFEFLDKPDTDALIQALQVLYALGAINGECKLTRVGRQMIALPVEPIMAKTILEAHKRGCLDVTLVIIAMLSELGMVFYRPKKKKQESKDAHKALAQPGGDHFTLLYVYKLWEKSAMPSQWCFQNYVQPKTMKRAKKVVQQLKRLCDKFLLESDQSIFDREAISQAFLSGYVTNIAKLSNNGEFYTTLSTNLPVVIHPSSFLSGQTPKYIIYNEIVVTSKEFMRGCLAVENVSEAATKTSSE